MNKQVMVIEYNGERVKATHYCGESQKSLEMWDFENENDFLFCCAYLIDEMATPIKPDKAFCGRAICTYAKEGSGFAVGKIYNWENGRTVNDYLQIYPVEYRVSEGQSDKSIITAQGNRFVVLRGNYENNN